MAAVDSSLAGTFERAPEAPGYVKAWRNVAKFVRAKPLGATLMVTAVAWEAHAASSSIILLMRRVTSSSSASISPSDRRGSKT